MPCRYNPTEEQYSTVQRDADKATRAACNALGILDARGMLGDLTEETQRWWARHQKNDQKRIDRERQSVKNQILDLEKRMSETREALHKEIRELQKKLVEDL